MVMKKGGRKSIKSSREIPQMRLDFLDNGGAITDGTVTFSP